VCRLHPQLRFQLLAQRLAAHLLILLLCDVWSLQNVFLRAAFPRGELDGSCAAGPAMGFRAGTAGRPCRHDRRVIARPSQTVLLRSSCYGALYKPRSCREHCLYRCCSSTLTCQMWAPAMRSTRRFPTRPGSPSARALELRRIRWQSRRRYLAATAVALQYLPDAMKHSGEDASRHVVPHPARTASQQRKPFQHTIETGWSCHPDTDRVQDVGCTAGSDGAADHLQ